MSIISQIPKIANVVKNNVSTANNTDIPFLNIVLVLMGLPKNSNYAINSK